MGRCGTQEVELLDGRMLGLDPDTADRLDMLFDNVPEQAREEVHKMCMCITGSKSGFLEMPNARWRDRFKTTIGSLLNDYDISLTVGAAYVTLYTDRYLNKQGRRKRG